MNPPEDEKKLAEELRLRPERPTVTRLSRKVLITLAGISSSLVLGLTLWALHERSRAKPPPELYNTDAKTTADGLAALPRDYTALPKNVPKLGPPLPGDLGRPILAAQGQSPQSTIDSEGQRIGQEREAARILLDGDHRSVERETIKKAVKERTIRLVVATDAACEGLNLQTLGTLIDVDLPWNPSRLEQRIGRIKRFGQRREKVDMLNLVYQGTIDGKVYATLSQRMRNRYDIFGTLPDVIDDDWIDDIESLDEKLREFTTKRKQANAFDLRYAEDVTEDEHRWELCERVLARTDVTKRLSRGWGEREKEAA